MSRPEKSSGGQGKCPVEMHRLTDQEYNAPRRGGLEIPADVSDDYDFSGMIAESYQNASV